jgi:hypothetical protein
MHKSLTTVVVAVVALASAACATGPYQTGGRRYEGPSSRGGCYAGERRDDCSERLRYEQQSRRSYVWRGDHYEDQNSAGAAAAAGIIGFILGAAIAGSNSDRDAYNAHKNDRDWHARCASAHRGYDSHSGTYPGPDGYRRYCNG